jgi:hypothetical protein
MSTSAVDYTQRLASSLLASIADCCSFRALARLSVTCKLWNGICSKNALWIDPARIDQFWCMTVFDQQDWEKQKCAGVEMDPTGGAFMLRSKANLPWLNSVWLQTPKGVGSTSYITLPKGLSVSSLESMVKASKWAGKIYFEYQKIETESPFWQTVEKIKNFCVPETLSLLISYDNGTKGKSYQEKVKRVQEIYGNQIPALYVMAQLAMECLNSFERSIKKKLRDISVICEETIPVPNKDPFSFFVWRNADYYRDTDDKPVLRYRIKLVVQHPQIGRRIVGRSFTDSCMGSSWDCSKLIKS